MFLVSTLAFASADVWDPVRAVLDAYPAETKGYFANFALMVGNGKGNVFTHLVGTTTLDTPQQMASASKFPAAGAILAAVADGKLSLDDSPQKYLSYWTKDPADIRSRVKLSHLLSFTSGFWDSSAGASLPCMSGLFRLPYDECVEQIYNKVAVKYEPGTAFDYNSYHLQIAGSMASRAAGLPIDQFLDKYLFNKLNMTKSSFGKEPQLAATLTTTGGDYERYLRAYLTYDFIPKRLADIAEHDYTVDVNVTDKTKELVDWIGHYGFAHWYECLLNHGNFTDACRKAKIHTDPGLFGYYPLVDRALNYYFQIVFTHVTTLSDTKPTSSAINLRLKVKPLVDKIMASLM